MFHKNQDLRVKQKDIFKNKYKKRNTKFVTEKTEKQSFSNNSPLKTSYSVFEKQNEQNVFFKAQ
jgi:exonuclease VII large subunit